MLNNGDSPLVSILLTSYYGRTLSPKRIDTNCVLFEIIAIIMNNNKKTMIFSRS